MLVAKLREVRRRVEQYVNHASHQIDFGKDVRRRPVEAQRQGQKQGDKRVNMWCDGKLNDETNTC